MTKRTAKDWGYALPWCGVGLTLGGFALSNEIMLVCGLLYLAIDYSADRVIAAIKEGRQ